MDEAGRSDAAARFAVAVEEQTAAPRPGAPRRLRITGPDAASGATLTREYPLAAVEHDAYLDLFAQVARDFGTRVPRSREAAPPAPTFRASYRALLRESVSPELRYGYGDPAALRVGGDAAGAAGAAGDWYYLVVTSNDAPQSLPILRSRDLASWELRGFVLPEGRKPAWAADGEQVSDYWAPEMHRVGGEFRVYFVARDRHTRELAIGVATADRPDGPYAAAERPIVAGGVIDPHLFVAADGSALLFWKEDANDVWPGALSELLHDHPGLVAELFAREDDRRTAGLTLALWPWARTLEPMERFFVLQPLIEAVASSFGACRSCLGTLLERHADPALRGRARVVLDAMRTPMYAQPLSPDGQRLVGERTKVLENDQAWEAHLVEGMWVTEHDQRYYLFYAGNDFSTADYGIGVAVAPTPLGPYRKMPEPLLRSTAEWWGPGHPSVAAGPDGRPWLFLHAFAPGRTGYKVFRALLATPIAFEGDRVTLRA